METLEYLRIIFNKYLDNPLYVFKKCKDSIVVLKKLEDTITNESRSSVVDKNYAQFRGNKFYVEMIIDITLLQEKYEAANCIWRCKTIKYVRGTIVEEKDFDTDLENILAEGIHYFLTFEPAYYCHIGKTNGLYKGWYRNGQKNYVCVYKNGLLDGLYEDWHENGTKRYECNYENGECHGKFEEWDENNQKISECTYEKGKYHGKYEEWYKNGNKKIQCNYDRDIYDGLYEEWFEDGKKNENNILKKEKGWDRQRVE